MSRNRGAIPETGVNAEAAPNSAAATATDDALIRVYDAAGNVIQTQEHKGDFKEW